MPEDAPLNRHPTDLLDPKRLESESRGLFLPGLLCGFLFFVLLLRCIPSIDRPPVSGDWTRAPRLTLTFITVHPGPPHPSAPGKTVRPRSLRRSGPAAVPDATAPEAATPERASSAAPPDTLSPSRRVLLRAPRPDSGAFSDFPNLTDSTEILLRTPAAIAAREEKFQELERRFGKKTEHWKPEIFSDNTFGDKGMLRATPGSILDGARSLADAGRRLVKRVPRRRGDAPREEKPKRAGAESFRAAYGPELRFLILLWRDGETGPALLGPRDWAFLARDDPPGTPSSRELLSGMERDGLVVSLRKGEQRLYRAGCTRGDMLQVLVRKFSDAGTEAQRDSVRASIDLITRCTDLSTGRVVIPDSTE